jgi:hypothetical protein
MWCRLLLCTLSIDTLFQAVAAIENTRRLIVGGEPTEPHEYPFVALLGLYNPFTFEFGPVCGATILDSHHVVTAAHCVNNIYSGWQFMVLSGVYSIDNLANEFSRTDPPPARASIVKHVHVHPLFDIEATSMFTYEGQTRELYEFTHDVAVLETIDDLGWKGVSGFGDAATESVGTAVGWGYVGNDAYEMSLTPNKLDMTVVGMQQCTRHYWYVNANVYVGHSTHMCAGGQPSQSVCNGDSGSAFLRRVATDASRPSTYAWHLIGIPSFALSPPPNCGAIHSEPSVFTRVHDVIEWICTYAPTSQACINSDINSPIRVETVIHDPTSEVRLQVPFNSLNEQSLPANVHSVADTPVVYTLPSSFGLAFTKLPQFYPHSDWLDRVGTMESVLAVHGEYGSFTFEIEEWTGDTDDYISKANFTLQRQLDSIVSNANFFYAQDNKIYNLLNCPWGFTAGSSTSLQDILSRVYNPVPLRNSSDSSLPPLIPMTNKSYDLSFLNFGVQTWTTSSNFRPGSRISHRRQMNPRIDTVVDLPQLHSGSDGRNRSSSVVNGAHPSNDSVDPSQPTAQWVSTPSVQPLFDLEQHVELETRWASVLQNGEKTSDNYIMHGISAGTWAAIHFKKTPDSGQESSAIAWYHYMDGSVSAPIIMGGGITTDGYDIQQYCAVPSISPEELQNPTHI